MAEKRIIEQTSSTEIYSGDWFVKDSAADGTTKIQPSKVKEYMNAGTATSDDLADEYDSTHSYSEGDVCTYEDVLYKANASTTGTWDITKWDAVTVADLIEEGGKVKDVKVNGASVVDEDKTANVSVPVLDVTVNGGSVVNNSKVAVLDALATYGEASGAIATFSDGSNLPVKELKVAIEPVQSGSGDPSPTNVRPISGWDEVNVTVADDVDNPTVENVYTIDLDGTRYGGTLNVTTGLLVVKNHDANLPDLNWNTNATNIFYVEISDIYNRQSGQEHNALCSCYAPENVWRADDLSDKHFMIRGDIKRIYIRDTDYTSAQAFKTAVAGQKLVYELATPIEVQLTPTQVNTILGKNNLYADSGDINKVVYVRDNSLIIDNILSRLEALEG